MRRSRVRIIAGSAKGAKLAVVPRGVRPVSDRAREGLFSSLADRVPGARVLDLFAGTGALGIEALSRGAANATFVDRDPGAIAAIRSNLERTHLSDRARVIRSDVSGFLTRTSNREPVDLCMLDPPYATPEREIRTALVALAAGGLAGHDWTVVLTRPTRSSTLVIPVDWAVARRLEYGDSLVVCYREE